MGRRRAEGGKSQLGQIRGGRQVTSERQGHRKAQKRAWWSPPISVIHDKGLLCGGKCRGGSVPRKEYNW